MKENKNNIEESEEKPIEKKDTHKKKKKNVFLWGLKIFIITFFISLCFSILSEMLMSATQSVVGTIISISLLVVIILISIIADILGVAVASASTEPFMAMAARKVKGAKMGLKLVKSADKVSNFFCDIVGDALGILSGTIGAGIVAQVAISGEVWQVVVSGLMSAIISAFTVFGKAMGKTIAINKSNDIIFGLAKFLSIFKKDK